MSYRFPKLQCVTHADRHDAIDVAKQVLAQTGAWIIDFSMFSNHILTIRFTIEKRAMQKMLASFEAAPELTLYPDSLNMLQIWCKEGDVVGDDKREVNGSLVIQFIHNDPDLRIEVPAVPG